MGTYAFLNRGRLVALCVALAALVLSWSGIHAQEDAQWLTLLPAAQADYRFDYRGDRTPILVTLEAPGVEDVEVAMYAPGETESMGRGTRQGDLFLWTGKSRIGGIYHAVVRNKTPGPIRYRISITGEGVSGVGQVLEDASRASASAGRLGAQRMLAVSLPPGAGLATLRLTSPAEPQDCTPAARIPPVITFSIKLCPNEIYPPLHISGSRIGLFGDSGRTAVINVGGRQYGLVVQGSQNWIDGIVIQSSPDPADAGAFLCQYDECVFATQPERTVINGGIAYGGGILLQGSNTVIHGVTVRGGTIGIATANGRGNYLIDNRLDDLNGWGNFNVSSVGSYFVGNSLNRNNHACQTPDGFKFEHGCETAGWVCLACINNIIANNHCERSGNCYYMSGERGLASNDNSFIHNYCAGATDNCFEITFAQRGNILRDNVTTADPTTGAACKYPFWIGGSKVTFANNSWQCRISAEQAVADATASTTVPTLPIGLATVPTARPPAVIPRMTAVPRTQTNSPTPTTSPTPTFTPLPIPPDSWVFPMP